MYGTNYRIRLDHQLLTDHGVFYPQAVHNDLKFEVTLAPTSQVVRGSDPTKLKYKLTNTELEYKVFRSNTLADGVFSVYTNGKEFTYDHVIGHEVVPFRKYTDSRLTIKVDPQGWSMKEILLLFADPMSKAPRTQKNTSFLTVCAPYRTKRCTAVVRGW